MPVNHPSPRLLRKAAFAAALLIALAALIVLVANLAPKMREARLSEVETKAGLISLRGTPTPFDGNVIEYYKSGKRLSLTPVVRGKVHGWTVGWFENGRTEVKEHFKNGVSDGTRTRWYSNGQVRSITTIRNGQIEGVFREWYENGKPFREVAMKNGKPDGPAVSWSPNGQVAESFTYANGTLVTQPSPKPF